MAKQDRPEKDEITGVETTGHEWDGIKELNNPLPRWWLWVFYATVIWAIGYWIVMPAWPLINGYTEGVIDYSSRAALESELEVAREAQSVYLDRIQEASLQQVGADPELLEFAVAGGRSAFAVNCSQCHGRGAAGGEGYPNLNDDEWIWGGTLEDIHATIHYGIRSEHPDTRQNVMMAFGRDGILDREQIDDVAEYVLSLSGRASDSEAAERGEAIFAEQCVSCHMEGGVGSSELGAPNLANEIWLYGGTKSDIVRSIANGRAGVMPAWSARLDDTTIKQLAVYVHSLGGGQ